MIEQGKISEYYRAFVERDSGYDGIFYIGIQSTGIFCRPTCPARKAKQDNCEFFSTIQHALLAGFRPCKRCTPLRSPGSHSQLVNRLITAVEQEPIKRWRDEHVRQMGIDPSTARRQFKKQFGMTFIAFARAQRLGIGLKTIRNGEKTIFAQLDSGYHSANGFRDAFEKIMGERPNGRLDHILYAKWIETPLGAMLALTDERALHLLEFTDRRGLENEIVQLRQRKGIGIIPGETDISDQISQELKAYFGGKLQIFQTPLHFYGSDFQQSVLQVLRKIPYGQTCSYSQQAKRLGMPRSVRAVASANGRNQIAILIPCHRVIGADGRLTGYAGGLARKQWLLDHEKNVLKAARQQTKRKRKKARPS